MGEGCADGGDEAEEVDVEVVLPRVEAEAGGRDGAGGLEHARAQDYGVEARKGVHGGGDGGFERGDVGSAHGTQKKCNAGSAGGCPCGKNTDGEGSGY